MTERFKAVKAGLIVTVAAFSFYMFIFAAPHIAASARKPQTLPSWSTDKIRAQMGEAAQVTDGTPLNLPAGYTCRFWLRSDHSLLTLCNP